MPPKPSPTICGSNPTKGCKVINDWAQEMYDWGLTVYDKFREYEGGPTDVPPPPKPPFK